MRRADDIRVWMVTGALGSMALAIALIPLRGMVAASNLAFVFVAFTIIVAELGGRGPALVTALVSAMSLNFFLTEPYLTLAISKTDDVIAFFALAACGLIAAAFGQRRERLSEAAGRADKELAILNRLVERARSGRPLEGQLQDLRAEFDLGGLVLRDEGGRVLAAVPADAGARPAPRMALDGATLFAAGDESPRMGDQGPAAARGRRPADTPDRPRPRVARPVGGQRPGVRTRREPDARDRRLDPRSRDAVGAWVSW